VWPILGVDIPLARIPLRPGRNIASLIEVVARNQLLKYRGHDSAREFQEKINARIAASARGVKIPGTVVAPPRADVPVTVARGASQAMPIPEVE
jgi:HPr kinase/phosphorylase